MLLDIAKLLLDKETRESFKEVVALVKKKPEWKADIVEMLERFKRDEDFKARLYVQFTVELLAQKGWQSSRVGVAEFAIQEVVDNAFVHGLNEIKSSGKVQIRSLLSGSWIRCTVTDDGAGFDLGESLRSQSTGEERGLSKVAAIATKLTQLNPTTLEIIIASAPGTISLAEENGIRIVTLAGEFRDDTSAHLSNLESIHRSIPVSAKVIVDLSSTTYMSSRGLRFLTLLRKQLSEKQCSIVMVVAPNSRMREILEIARYTKLFICTDTLDVAIAMLGKS